jgi:hypothetical protein
MADKKPLVVDLTSGKTRQIATGETVPLANGGTGATTQAGAANAVLPTQSGHSGEFLTTNGSAVSWGAAGGGGTVTTTGSPASGFLAFFSGATSITSGDLSGDVSTSGTGATTIGALKIATGMVQASAITLAKIQNAAASSKLLGSGASGSGSAYVEITLGTNLSMSGTTLNASGGGGSPGGSSGQIQWNNAGSFDGFTMSGDATLVTSTGVITLATVTVPKGGTGATTLTNHGVLLGQGTAAVAATTAGTAGHVLTSGGASADPSFQVSSGRLIGRQVITTTGAGTYTPTSGTASIVIELQGGGGGGAGAGANPGAGNISYSIGGGGGAWLSKRLTANFSGAAYVVGAKGSGGTAGANNGTAGSNTTFTDTAGSPTVYTAGGGAAGTFIGTFGVGLITASAAGGTATNGDTSRPGGVGPWGYSPATTQVIAPGGGSSMYDPGAPPVSQFAINSSVAGNSAAGFGGGGGAAVSEGATATARAGGDGSNGVIIIWEYS